jgi:hypothetical protein
MKRSEFKRRLAEEVHAGWKGFASYILGKAEHLPDGSLKISKTMADRWKRMADSTHYKLRTNEKVWAETVVERILTAMENIKRSITPPKTDPRVTEIKLAFVDYCKDLRGFDAVIDHGRDGAMIKKRLETNTKEDILDCFDWFLNNRDFDNFSPSISTALSTGLFNKFLSKR